MDKRIGWGGFCAVVGVITLIIAGVMILTTTPAKASVPPYGGCKEVMQVLDDPGMVDSSGARYCRHHGWIVRRHVAVDPHGVAVTNLPRCAEEDSKRCYWNAKRRGNHAGHGFIALSGRLIYVDHINGRRVTTGPLQHKWFIVPA